MITVYIDMNDAFDEQTAKELYALFAVEKALYELKSDSDVISTLLADTRSVIETILEQETEDNAEVDMDCYTQIKSFLGYSDDVFTLEDFLGDKEKHMQLCELIFA